MIGLDGIDVSYAQRVTPDLTGLAFAFARATYGTSIDSMYATHSANFRKAGLVAGAYAFGTFGDGPAQALALLDVARGADLLALDLETEHGKPRMTDDQARAFIAAVHGVGRKIGLYHSDSGYPFLGQDWDWVAKWGPDAPRRHWSFWQWQGAPLDRDRFTGSLADLVKLAGIPSSAPETLMPMYLVHPRSGTLTLKAGTTVHGYAPRTDGTGWELARTWGPKPTDATARFDTNLERLSGATTPTALLHVVGGYFDGLYVSTAEVSEAFDLAAQSITTGG